MELIPYEQFGKLRLTQFAPPDLEVDESDGWVWMGGYWINEGIGFTSMSRHVDTPEETGGLEVDFAEFPESAVSALLDAIHLPLRRGMAFEEIHSALGEPEREHVYAGVEDRKSYKFTVGSGQPYHVSATVHETDGLIYVTVVRKDVLSRCDV